MVSYLKFKSGKYNKFDCNLDSLATRVWGSSVGFFGVFLVFFFSERVLNLKEKKLQIIPDSSNVLITILIKGVVIHHR